MLTTFNTVANTGGQRNRYGPAKLSRQIPDGSLNFGLSPRKLAGGIRQDIKENPRLYRLAALALGAFLLSKAAPPVAAHMAACQVANEYESGQRALYTPPPQDELDRAFQAALPQLAANEIRDEFGCLGVGPF